MGAKKNHRVQACGKKGNKKIPISLPKSPRKAWGMRLYDWDTNEHNEQALPPSSGDKQQKGSSQA